MEDTSYFNRSVFFILANYLFAFDLVIEITIQHDTTVLQLSLVVIKVVLQGGYTSQHFNKNNRFWFNLDFMRQLR